MFRDVLIKALESQNKMLSGLKGTALFRGHEDVINGFITQNEAKIKEVKENGLQQSN